MSGSFETTQRFFRPTDVGRTRRNYRRVQVGRLFVVARNALLICAVAIASLAAYRHVQSGRQFAVKTIVIDGAVHTPRSAIDAVTKQYVGMNLFKLDIPHLRRELGNLAWIRHVDVEASVPDALHIRIAERTPVALVDNGGTIGYVDEQGMEFAALSANVGDNDLPLIHVTPSVSEGPGGAGGATNAGSAAVPPPSPLADARGDIARCVKLLHDVRVGDPQLYARISEISPIAPAGFAIFDRELGALVYADGNDISARWRDLRAIVAAENLGRGAIEYADLRFADRVIVKTVKPMALANAEAPAQQPPTQITN